MLTFNDVPFIRNFSCTCDKSHVANLRSRVTDKSVMRPLLFFHRMPFMASEEVCHDVA